MKYRYLGVAVSLLTLSGCAGDLDGPESNVVPTIDESTIQPQSVTGVTAPPAGVGFAWLGNFKVRNGMNNCTYIAAANEVKVKPCDATAQTWAVYNAGSHYNFCKPNTLKLFSGYYIAECWISDQTQTTNAPFNAPTVVYENVSLAHKNSSGVWGEDLTYEISTNSNYPGFYLRNRFTGETYLSESSGRVLTKSKFTLVNAKYQLWQIF